MLVQEFLENSARLSPNKEALICKGQRLTYLQVESLSNQLAHALLEAGVQRGDRIAIYMPNTVHAVIAIFAALKAGGVFVVINASTRPEKMAYILNNCRATALITCKSRLSYLPTLWSDTPHLHSVFLSEASEQEAAAVEAFHKKAVRIEDVIQDTISVPPPSRCCIDIDLAALIYTSGSTGRPKGVMVTHLNIVSAATSITTYLENTGADIVINVLPLAFDYGLYQLLMMFKVGGTLVLHDSMAFPNVILETIEREDVTGFPIVPTILALLLQMDLSKYRLPKLRYISNTAAALPIEYIRKLRALFPDVQLYSMYGLTECKRVSYLPPNQIDIRPASVGRGMPNEEVYIVDEAGRRVEAGVVGELVIRGANVMKGYWELPEETDRCLKPGPLPGEKVLYSGDLFRADEQGYLFFVGRKDDIIKTRGEKVSPREVEDAIYEIDGVTEVAVIGIPDPILGSAIKAVVVLRPGAQVTRQDILRHCSQKLEDFMIPRVVEFQATLPKTETGKISKRLIAAEAAKPSLAPAGA